MMLIQLMAFVLASIFSPLLAITASRVPMKMGMINFKVATAVARANVCGFTVGKVEIAPFDTEYGNGHSRIMISNLRPSYFRTEEKASNRLSLATSLCTNPEKIVRDVMNEHVDPATVAVAIMSQLRAKQSVAEIGCKPYQIGPRLTLQAAIYEASKREAG